MSPPRAEAGHEPVMLREVLAALAPADGEHHVDGTFGAVDSSKVLVKIGQVE